MGCCCSLPASPSSSDDGDAVEIEPSAITAPAPAEPASGATPASSRRRRREQHPLDQHINRPLRRHTWTSTDRSWTRGELARERAEYFDTRVSGRPEIWQALHAALQVLWETAASENPHDVADGLATAQSLLDAAEISLITGNLIHGAYDALGSLYPLPQPIVSDPDNVLSDEDKKQRLSGTGHDAARGNADGNGNDDDDDEDDDDDDVIEVDRNGEPVTKPRRIEKGKGLVEGREMVNLRARLSDTGKDILISVHASEKVRSVIKKISLKCGHDSNRQIKIAYLGRILRENASLEAQGWNPDHVVNAMVFPPKSTQ